MSDTPDFDSMSPEEMMEWMESLAKRQGAAEGFTTNASMEVDEVDENDERLAGLGEYKPYGMSDEDWAKMQEREAAEKAARQAAQRETASPPIPPEPEPEIEPERIEEISAQAASADEMPDFDSMSPEEMMEWMESLAKRQGADEGFTTNASMAVGEIDENDERLAGLGEYKPYGMSDEDWAKMQEREATEKAARRAARDGQTQTPQAPAMADDEFDEYTYEDDEDYVDSDDDEFYFESGDSEELIAATLDFDDVTEEAEELPSFDDIFPAQDAQPQADNPMDWLANLSGGDSDDAPDLDFNMDALGDLAGLGEAEEAGDPMEWLAGLSDSDESGIDLSEITDKDDELEGSLEWIESLAASQGVNQDELITDADLDIPIPDSLNEDGPGYEDFSFEEATGMVQDTGNAPPVKPPSETPAMALDDPESWLDSLASGVSNNELPDDLFDNNTNEIPDEIFNELDDEYEYEYEEDEEAEEIEDFDNLASSVKAQMDSGRLGDSPDDINKFFQSAFEKAGKRTDVPDYIDADDEDIEAEVDEIDSDEPVQADIPDWLQESMASVELDAQAEDDVDDVIEPSKKTATAEMMIADLGLDDDSDDSLPDWLQSGQESDTGVIDLDIFADEDSDDDEEEPEAIDELNILDVTDTQDTWVEAFSKQDSQEMQEWYKNALASLEGNTETADEADVMASATDEATSLQAVDLPIERQLDEGTPQNVPDWMTDKAKSIEVEAVQDDGMDWLGEDDPVSISEAQMPDWLQETVDDSVTTDADLPDWLAGETDISADEIPDWLRETMEDEEEPVALNFDEELMDTFDEDIEDEEPVATPVQAITPVNLSPAPQIVDANKVDVVALLRSANEKTNAKDIDGAMHDYEQIIRANKALPQVEKELQRLSEDKAYKKNPAVNRVLGDVLMRQGKLQEALDTYRKALNML
ncbi:MAG: hypothetical protein ACFE0Q_11325 [Anaerolineae bacterium]